MEELSVRDLMNAFLGTRSDHPGRKAVPFFRPKDPEIERNPVGCTGLRVFRAEKPVSVSEQQQAKLDAQQACRKRRNAAIVSGLKRKRVARLRHA